MNEQLLEIARREIAQCRVEGMDEEDIYFMVCGALLSHGRKTGTIGEELSNEMVDAIRVLVQEAMNTEAQL